MAYGLSKIEGRVTVPTGGYSMTVTDSGGTKSVIVLAAGSYYPNSPAGTSILATIGTALTADSTLAGTYTLTSDDTTTTATGKTTLTVTGGGANVQVTWDSTVLRDLLGFSASLTGAATYQSPKSCQYMFLPNVKRANPMVPEGQIGSPMTDGTFTLAPSGKTKTLTFATRYRDRLEFRFLSGTKTWTCYEVVANESLQSFWLKTIGLGLPLRYYPDRTDDTTYADWRVTQLQDFMVQPEFAGFVGGAGTDGATLSWKYGPVDVVRFV
jgi:hypothetical protein